VLGRLELVVAGCTGEVVPAVPSFTDRVRAEHDELLGIHELVERSLAAGIVTVGIVDNLGPLVADVPKRFEA
jgi:hypothetical protein